MAGMLPRSATSPPVFVRSFTDTSRHTSEQSSTLNTARTRSESYGSDSKLYSADNVVEFDEYGAELGKEAKVWKVYVDETNKWDTEHVDGWNKSLDVILVFAALFSAISTAFLIESSNRLRADPADDSTQTLLIISRTLLAISNNTRPPDLDSLPNANQEAAFEPSRSAVLVNALWYSSLSLSVATSFLAMLAKDWCHSFMAGRVGHPCIQARRRQQKWNMIERWKMQEIIQVLPSLIHLSLFLFAIGLCIDVLDTNVSVAIPVIGITGLSVVFYLWSSLTAIWVHESPYATIISRILRSELTLASMRWGLQWSLLPLIVGFHSRIHRWHINNNWIPSLNAPLSYLIDISRRWTEQIRAYIGLTASCSLQKENPEQDLITSSALGWLIEHCKVPHSVETALQAIAGASARLPHGPLKRCNASLQISRRLALGRLHKGTASGSENKTISLYLRALSILAPDLSSQDSAGPAPGADTGEIEVMVWDLHFENENRAAELMAEGDFEPNDLNLEALRIGGMAASLSVKLLHESQESSSVQEYNQILGILQHHAQRKNREHRLHRIACLSLVNAAILLSASSNGSQASADLAGVCLKILQDDNLLFHLDLHLAVPLITCALLQRRISYDGKIDRKTQSRRFRPFFRVLINQPSSSKRSLAQFVWSAVLTLLSNPSNYGISMDESHQYSSIFQRAMTAASCSWSELSAKPSSIMGSSSSKSSRILARIQGICQAHAITQLESMGGEEFLFAVKSILRTKSESIGRYSWGLMSQLRFPQPSAQLNRYLNDQDIIPALTHHLNDKSFSKQFIAAAHLWLLCAVYLQFDPPTNENSEINDVPATPKLSALIHQHVTTNGEKTLGSVKEALSEQIEGLCNNTRWVKEHNAIYVYRVLECVLQSRGAPSSDPRWEIIRQVLTGVSQNLRGLGSFTLHPMHQSNSQTGPKRLTDGEMTSTPKHHAILIEEATKGSIDESNQRIEEAI